MQTDLSDGVAYLAGRGLADPKRACIVGASYGGYAALYAGASGYHIQRLVSLSEESTGTPGPVRPMMMMAKADSTPVMAGQLTVRVDVSGVYELAK